MVRTRARNYNHEEEEEEDVDNQVTPVPILIPRNESLVDRRSRWAGLLRSQNYHKIITEVLGRELPKYGADNTVIPSPLSDIMRECVLILASAPLIFTAAVEGVLTHKYPQDTNLQSEYVAMQERAHVQPSIYIHLLADEQGIAPTINQCLLIRDTVIKYMDLVNLNNDLAYQIDNITLPSTSSALSQLGFRKYLSTVASAHSPARLETLSRFCAGMQQRWLETPPALRDSPLQYPPAECGYALHSHRRFEQHRRRQSSNYVMNLVEDICSYLHATGVFPQRFYMHQFIIYLIFRPSQAEIAEIFCSGLLQVWVDNGGGFNHYPAGRSNRSARGIGDEEWKDHKAYIEGSSGLVENVRLQVLGVEEVAGVLDVGAGMLWREAVEDLG